MYTYMYVHIGLHSTLDAHTCIGIHVNQIVSIPAWLRIDSLGL